MFVESGDPGPPISVLPGRHTDRFRHTITPVGSRPVGVTTRKKSHVPDLGLDEHRKGHQRLYRQDEFLRILQVFFNLHLPSSINL